MPEPDPDAVTVVVTSPSSRESVQTRARRYLAEGRVTVVRRVPGAALVRVRGTEQVHEVTWSPGSGWSCSCEARGRCSHGVAASLIVVAAAEDVDRGWPL